jgi:hypothetical protein
MNNLPRGEVKQQLSQSQTSSATNDNDDDDEIFLPDETNDDDQARIRRRAPTRHSIKSLTGRKTVVKQSSSTEVK